MNHRFLIIFLIVLLISSIFVSYNFLQINPSTEHSEEVFVGIDVAYDDLENIKKLIDEVNPYTNLFVIGSTGISYNETLLNETCEYLYEKDMYFIIYTS